MRLWTAPFRLVGILALAALVSAGWLFRHQILRVVRAEPAIGPGVPPRALDPAAVTRAHDKIDSLHGWRADSVVLSAAELGALVREGMVRETRNRLDSMAVALGDDRLTLSALLETTRIPRDALGPLAGALRAWEPIAAGGPLVLLRPGQAEWRVESLTLRGFTLPEAATRELVSRALPGAHGGAVPVVLPRGIAGLRIRPGGAALYREDTR